jgi:hypothetical protein
MENRFYSSSSSLQQRYLRVQIGRMPAQRVPVCQGVAEIAQPWRTVGTGRTEADGLLEQVYALVQVGRVAAQGIAIPQGRGPGC